MFYKYSLLNNYCEKIVYIFFKMTENNENLL